MTATMTLYRYQGLPQVINKNLVKLYDLTGDFRQPLTLMNPVFVVTGTDNQGSFLGNSCNYCEIEGNYYYLMDYQIMPKGAIQISLHLDVLMTYKEQINNLEVMLDRSSNATDKDIADQMLPLSANKDITTQDFPRGLSESEDQGCYVLITSQNGYTPAT